jgi:hypothetical protein
MVSPELSLQLFWRLAELDGITKTCGTAARQIKYELSRVKGVGKEPCLGGFGKPP